MYALAIKNLPDGKDWLYEVKFDGYRCLAGRRDNGVTLWSRRGNLFTAQFPHIAAACEGSQPTRFSMVKLWLSIKADESPSICFSITDHTHRRCSFTPLTFRSTGARAY
jgi:hypothetical protein